MCEAEQYLRNPDNPPFLYVSIDGKKRRLFINRDFNEIGIIAPGMKKRGYIFNSWNIIEKIYYPSNKPQRTAEEKHKRLLLKYQKMAAKATFTNPFIQKVMKADPNKKLYENDITTGVTIEGEVISLEAVRKWCGTTVLNMFKEAIQNKTNFDSSRFDFRGYDGSLWVRSYTEGENYLKPGEVAAGFSKEYRNCGNGYYYLLINDDNFIGYDID